MKKKNLATLSLLIVLSIQSMSAQKHDDISLLEKPVPISTVKGITGFFGERMEVNRQYLKDFPIDTYVDFIVNRQHTAWDWTKAEQHGKWVESAYLSAIQSGDKELQKKVQAVLKRIIDSQEESGYVGATAKSRTSGARYGCLRTLFCVPCFSDCL